MEFEEEVAITPTKKEVKKKLCPICKKERSIATGFYKSSSPLFSIDGCVPICISCVKNEVVNEDGTINEGKLKTICQRLDKPFYLDDLDSAFLQYKSEHGYLSNDEVAKNGKEIVGLYFKNIGSLRQNRNRSFADSEKDGFTHKTMNNSQKAKKENIENRYTEVLSDAKSQDISPTAPKSITVDNKEKTEELIYDEKWMGSYTKKDLDYLNTYYSGLEKDYKIITINHRDYARKIAKASLQMDKSFDDMLNGVDGADARYKNARETFDTLSKSAKFSESTRSVNDVGATSFSKVASMVEAHNWIPEHHPLEKDVIDEMIDYLSTITKSL